MSWHVMSGFGIGVVEWILHICVCVCMHVYVCKKVLILAYDEYMWQQAYSLCFYAKGDCRKIHSIEWNECYWKLQEHHRHFEAPSLACLSGLAPEFASWTRWPDRPPSPRELGRHPGELFVTILQLQHRMHYAGWTAPDWDCRMRCWVKYLCLPEAYAKSTL